MARSLSLVPTLALAAFVAAQRPLPENGQLVLSDVPGDLPLREFGLGEGGVGAERGELTLARDGGECTTPGGVRVQCLQVGVKLTFASGRELLFAPDGVLHLRSGERAGPWSGGVELLLADGAAVQITLSSGSRKRLHDVVVTHGERALQPWRDGRAEVDVARVSRWAGVRLACCGDGGDLYRPYALGPLVILDRELVAADREQEAPGERLVLLTEPLRRSLQTMGRQHRDVDKDVRHAVTTVAAVADHGSAIFPAGATLRRAEKDALRWLLAGGFELAIDLEGPLSPRLMLFAGRGPRPMVEWTLSAAGAAYLTNPDPEQVGKRWHGNGTRLPRVLAGWQVREHLLERPRALAVLRRLLPDGNERR